MTVGYEVLVVDDDETALRLSTSVLESDGFHVTAVMSGSEAFDQLASRPPDLVLLDVVMP